MSLPNSGSVSAKSVTNPGKIGKKSLRGASPVGRVGHGMGPGFFIGSASGITHRF